MVIYTSFCYLDYVSIHFIQPTQLLTSQMYAHYPLGPNSPSLFMSFSEAIVYQRYHHFDQVLMYTFVLTPLFIQATHVMKSLYIEFIVCFNFSFIFFSQATSDLGSPQAQSKQGTPRPENQPVRGSPVRTGPQSPRTSPQIRVPTEDTTAASKPNIHVQEPTPTKTPRRYCILGSYGTVVVRLKIWRRKLVEIACE